jgi:hypothetical protein
MQGNARRRTFTGALLLTLGVVLVPTASAQATVSGSGTIFTCTDAQGRKLTSDRLIAECIGREQRVLNRDGSVQRVIPPTMTADERAEFEAREQRRHAEIKAQQEAVRRDRNLVQRFPNEAVHQKAREAALDDIRKSVQTSESRLKTLAAERKPLMDEAEFYVGKKMPAQLKQQLDANDAATEAQKALVQNQQAEVGRINALYDAELGRLKKLWAGAPAGSLGPLPVASAPASGAAPIKAAKK